MKKFKKIYIEITNICNLNCAFCPKHSRENKIMSCEEFEYILSKVHSRGEKIYLHIMGEPTGHPQLEKILDICKKYSVRANITTNGTLLKSKENILLNGDLMSLAVSVHSFEANSSQISMEEYLENIMNFCNKAMGLKCAVELRLWNLSKENIADNNSLNHKILSFIYEKLNLDFDIFSLAENTFLSMDKNRKKNFRLKENIFLGMSEQFSWPSIKNSYDNSCSGFCYGLRNQIGFLSDGTVVPCCLDSDGNISLGNIFCENLDEILKNERSLRLYNGFTNQKAVEPLCQNCGYMHKYFTKRHK